MISIDFYRILPDWVVAQTAEQYPDFKDKFLGHPVSMVSPKKVEAYWKSFEFTTDFARVLRGLNIDKLEFETITLEEDGDRFEYRAIPRTEANKTSLWQDLASLVSLKSARLYCETCNQSPVLEPETEDFWRSLTFEALSPKAHSLLVEQMQLTKLLLDVSGDWDYIVLPQDQ